MTHLFGNFVFTPATGRVSQYKNEFRPITAVTIETTAENFSTPSEDSRSFFSITEPEGRMERK